MRAWAPALVMLAGCGSPPAVVAPAPEAAPVAIEEAPKEVAPVVLEALGTIGGPASLPSAGERLPAPDGRMVELGEDRLVFGDGAEVEVGEEAELAAVIAPQRALLTRDGATELWSPKGRLVRLKGVEPLATTEGAFVVRQGRDLAVHDAEGKVIGSVIKPAGYRTSVALGDRGRALLVTEMDAATLFDVTSGRTVATVSKKRQHFESAGAVSADGQRFTTHEGYGPLVIRSRSGAAVKKLSMDRYDEIHAIAFVGERVVAQVQRISDPYRVIVLGDDGSRELPGASFIADPVDDGHVWMSGPEGLVRCRVDTGTCPPQARHGAPIHHLAVTNGGRLVVSSAADGSVFAHRLTARAAESSLLLRAFRSQAPRVAVSPAGVAVAGFIDPKAKRSYGSEPAQSLVLYPVAKGSVAAKPAWSVVMDGYSEDVTSLAASVHGMVALDEEGDLRLYDDATGRVALALPVGRFTRHDLRDRTVPSVLAPDGATLLQHDAIVAVPDGATVAPPWSVEEGKTFDVQRCVASPRGTAIVCPEQRDLHRRSSKGWQTESLTGVGDARFAEWAVSDEGVLAFGIVDDDDDAKLHLRSASDADGALVVSVPSAISALTFYAEGRRLLTGHRDGRLMIWQVPD